MGAAHEEAEDEAVSGDDVVTAVVRPQAETWKVLPQGMNPLGEMITALPPSAAL